MSTAADNQVNFNPAWMQAAPIRVDKGSLHRSLDSEDPNKTEMIAPVFAKHRYGREDILAMMPKVTRPPDGLRKCPFFVEEGQPPIILSSLNETELRLQQNINSSKALSLLTHAERIAIQNAGSGGGSQPSSPWQTAGGNKNAKPGSRWSALTTGDSPGGSTYVKAGMTRGSNSGGRGGGTAGSNRGRSGFDNNKGSYNPGNRSRLRSGSEDQDPGWTTVGTKAKDDASSVWRNVSGHHHGNEFSRQTSMSANVNTAKHIPETPVINDFEAHRGLEQLNLSHSPPIKQASPPHSYPAENEFTRQTSMGVNVNTAKHIPETNGHDPIQQILNSISATPPPVIENEMWFYLAPSGEQHGPYESPQMLIWYKSGFFQNDLRCRRTNDPTFTTLGELLQKSTSDNPFAPPKPERVMATPPLQRDAWGATNSDFYDSQRAILEEKRRLEERQEALRREEQERLEKERRLREMEAEIQRKQEELHKIAQAKEEELERKRRQLAEYEQRQRQEAERRLQEARAQEAQRLQDKLERERQELEEQHRKAEELLRRQQLEAAEEAARAREKAMIEAHRAAEEEHRRQLKLAQEQEQKRKEEEIRKQQEERRAAEERKLQEEQQQKLRAEHLQQLAEAQKRREAEEAVAKAAARAAAAASPVKAPWTATTKDKPHALQTQRSLLEIQLEEEKALEEKRRKEQQLFELQRKQAAVKPQGPWSGTTITSTVVPKTVWNESAKAATSKSTIINSAAWPAMPTPPPKKDQPKLTASQTAKKKPEPKKDDSAAQFQKWAIKAIRDLNKSVSTEVDPEMFFGFIESVVDPVDVEDYFVSYFGDNDDVKELQKKFLEKRIAMRSTQKKNDKDDLSAAQAAVNASTVQAGGKKKKKGQVKTIVDLNVLGFKAGSDPNRINAGEIDLTPPVSMKKKR